jgi:putative glutamine amidotransferase
MTRPLIGLTIGPGEAGPDVPRRYSPYTRAIELAGGVPVLIPPIESSELHHVLSQFAGIVFPGGPDVDPRFYGQSPHPKTKSNPILDEFELAVARWAVLSDTPILGICRGQQILNVALNGSLIQHLVGHRQPLWPSAVSHELRVAPDSRLARILGTTECEVNSFHHQAVDRLGQGLQPVAWAPDGEIEGLESQLHPWLIAVQFHPEEMIAFQLASRRLFAAFVHACSARRPVLSTDGLARWPRS